MVGHVVVCGLGHIGYRVGMLLRDLGEEVVVITEQARAEWAHAAEARGIRILTGDARDEVLLRDAGLAAKMQDSLGLSLATGQSAVTAPVFVACTFQQGVCSALRFRGHLLTVLDRDAATVTPAPEESGLRPLMARRKGAPGYVPLPAAEALQPGDRVLLAAWRVLPPPRD